MLKQSNAKPTWLAQGKGGVILTVKCSLLCGERTRSSVNKCPFTFVLVMMIIQLLYGILISIFCVFCLHLFFCIFFKTLVKWLHGRRTQLQMVNQSIIYDEWLIKEFVGAFMIHAESGVTMKRSDGDVTAQSCITTWKMDRLKPVGNPAARRPPSSHLLTITVIFFFFFFVI